MTQQPPDLANCELCNLAKLTRWFYSDAMCLVVECESCAVPMVVLVQHRSEPSEIERKILLHHLELAAQEFFANQSYFIDEQRRQIPQHYHAHARPRPQIYSAFYS